MRVPDLHGKEPRQRVEIALAGDVLDIAAVAAGHDPDLGLGLRGQACEMEPEVVTRRLLQRLDRQLRRGGRHVRETINTERAVQRLLCGLLYSIGEPEPIRARDHPYAQSIIDQM